MKLSVLGDGRAVSCFLSAAPQGKRQGFPNAEVRIWTWEPDGDLCFGFSDFRLSDL